MLKAFFVGGEAGSGKTRKLMEQAAFYGGQLLSEPHQTALVMAVMHGARKHLHINLRSFCPNLPVTVSTIHSFALKIANRWRRSLGLKLPIVIAEQSCSLLESNGWTHATFDEILGFACTLLGSATVRKTLSASHPFVIVDEFQDCSGKTLEFVQALGDCTTLLLAADHFQLLHDSENGCPAVDWVVNLKLQEAIECEELTKCHRTDTPGILRAARALRDNAKASMVTVPVYYGYTPELVAYRIVERFAGWGPAKRIADGTCALITPSMDDPQLSKLLKSFELQLKKKTDRRVNWAQNHSEEQHRKGLFVDLGIMPDSRDEAEWRLDRTSIGSRALAISEDIVRFCRLRGIARIPEKVARQRATLAVHNSRAYSRSSPRFQVLTVHGAKNREFDHVFVFWGYKRSGWSTQDQRRLLYNAVTRAKVDCTVLYLGSSKAVQEDNVVSLLGPAVPAIDPSWKNKKKRSDDKR